jgi:hypothetical protein
MTPFGAWLKPGCVGVAEWHGTHRRAITACAWAKLTPACDTPTPRGAMATANATTPTAALTGMAHTTRPW